MSQPLSRTAIRTDDRPGAPAEEAEPAPCIRAISEAPRRAPVEGARPGLFEHVVCRIAGLPADALVELRAEEAAEHLDELADADAAMAAESGLLSESLYAAIGATDERRRRHRLLQLRRDVHNLRRPRQADVAAGRRCLPAAAAAALDRYSAAAGRRAGALGALPAAYEAGVARCRRSLRRQVLDADFRNGLLLSSRTLFDELARYVATPPAAFTAKERQIERGLLRYLSRMAMKTSPFSTFTALAPGRLVDGDEATGETALPHLAGDAGRKHTVVRINKRILGVLRRELAADAEARRHLDVELNPTLHLDGDRWCFLASLDGLEAFQRLPLNPVLDLFQALLAGAPRCCAEVVDAVAASPAVDASRDQVEAYVDRLLELGFLRLHFGIPPRQADWDRPLAERLDGVPGEVAATARELMAALRSRRDRFAAAPVEGRAEPLDEATRVLRASFPALARQTRLRADVPFYEDAGSAATLRLPRRALGAAEESLLHYVRWTSRLAWPRHEAILMRRFFDRRYGAEPVPLLRFYEDFYRDFFKRHLERQAALMRQGAGGEGAAAEDGGYDAVNPLGDETIERLRQARERLTEAVRERWRRQPDAETLDLPRHALEEAFADLPPVAAETFSASAFVQVLPGEGAGGGTALLLSSLMPGFGKYFSRFLAVLPEYFQDELLRRNGSVEGGLLAEICADGDFNGNIHPPLVPWELVYPTVEAGAAARRLPATELVVEPHPRDRQALRLCHRDGGPRVLPLDLGFQNPRLRPPLFQLLCQLTPAAGFGFPVPASSDASREMAAGSEPRIDHRPRIVYDGHLVLARRRWLLPPSLLPRRRAGEGDGEYFLRADRWRREHGLPRELFVSLLSAGGERHSGDGDEEAGHPRRDHLHKPQYVDFANPLLVDLFARLGEEGCRGRLAVALYERLPQRRHLVAGGGRSWVTELVVQTDFPEGLGDGD